MAETRNSSWIEEQAAEYADLVGSFVESVHDEETAEMLEYQLIWEGGDLGVALTPMENEPHGVVVSRVTGKGFPFGIKNVGAGDILLSINLHDTTKLTLDQVVGYLQECDLPATLRFQKVSPDLDRVSSPAVPRVSHVIVTTDTPTSPIGSQRPSVASQRQSSTSTRASQKSVISVGTYAQRMTQRYSMASTRASMQAGRMSMASLPRPSENNSHMPPPPPSMVPVQSSAPTPEPKPVAPTPAPESVQKAEAVASAPAVAEKPSEAAIPAPVSMIPATTRLSEDRESWESEDDIDKARELLAELEVKNSEVEDIDDARKRLGALKLDEELLHETPPTLARGVSLEGEQQSRQHAQSVAMLGHFSIQTNGIPILPEESMPVIASIDGVPQEQEFIEVDEDISPVGHAIQPASIGRASQMPGMPAHGEKFDMPRESVRLTKDVAPEPMMKSQPIGALHELCAKGNLRAVMQNIKVNGPANLIQREANHGQTCLHLAVKSGNVQLVKHILEKYEPVDELINVEDDKGNTALHFAATKTPGMVHILLESGATANVKNSRKLTPLIISVITSRDDSIIIPRMLLKFGANPNDMHDSQTVIHTAIGSGLLNIAGALVHAGAKMDVEDVDGRSVYEKLDKKSIRFLVSHIYFPPTLITEKERTDCMLCRKKIKFGHRKNNCTHCGRFCCSECCSLLVEMYKFPMGFPGRIHKGAAVRELKKVCKTCYSVFKERGDTPQRPESRFLQRVINAEWDEVNPQKLQSYRAAGRRGEKD